MQVSPGKSDQGSPPRNKIFCIGLGRTGTTSLSQALAVLGYRANHLPTDQITQRELYSYFRHNLHTVDPLKLSILDEYDALADTPVCCVYQGLDHAYPGSLFILTVREKTSWLASQERLHQQILVPFFSTNPDAPDVQFLNFLVKTLVIRTLGEDAAQIFNDEIDGVAYYDRDVFSRLYDAYFEQVVHYFQDREDQLLVLSVVDGEGWEKLAPFLGVTIPDEPFPFEMRLKWRESPSGLGEESVSGEQDEQTRERLIGRVQDYLDAFFRHDLPTCMQYFSDDAVVKYFEKRYRGRRGIEKWHRDRFAAKIALLSSNGVDCAGDTVTADLTIASKFMRRWPVKATGRAVIRLKNEQIEEVGFENGRLIR